MERETSIRMDEINLRTILKDLIWNLPFVILAILIVLMGIRTYRNIAYEPEYTASTTLAVIAKGNAEGNAYSSLSTANSMAEVFPEIFQSDVVKEKVEEAIGKMPEGVKISSELIPETNLLVLGVTAKDPQSAYRVLQAILGNYKYVSDYLFGNAVLEVIMEPQVPVAPSNAFRTSWFDKRGIVVAVVLMVGLIVLCSVLRSTVKTTKAAKRKLEGECLAALPYEEKNRTLKGKIHKTNKAILLNSQIISFGYEESCHQLASCLEYKADKQGKKVILITSVAENEGKSTVCVNLAMALARRNKKVLLVDMDLRKPALYKLIEHEVKRKQGLLPFLKGETALNDAVQYDKAMQICTILNDKGIDDAQEYLNTERFERFLAAARKAFDYVILDSSPVSAGTDTEYLQEYADAALLIVRQDRVKISDLNDAVEMMKEGKSKFLGYVLNGFDKSGFGSQGGYGYGKYGKYGRYSRNAAENN